MQPGPIHLFWVTGVYYLWALKKKYSFVLSVDNDYAISDKFKKIVQYMDVKYIHYIKKKKGFRLVFDLLKEYEEILLKFKPSKILIHNSSFINNQCLIDTVLLKNWQIDIFLYQNARESLNYTDQQFFLDAVESKAISDKLKILKNLPKLVFKFAVIKQKLRYYYYFKIIPLFIKGKVFNPPFNVFIGKKNIKESIVYKKIVKKYFAYLNVEAEYAIKLGVPNCQIIEHPLITSGDKLNSILYDQTEAKNKILIAPSYGFLEGMLAKGQSDNEICQSVGQKYLNVIYLLLKKFPNYLISFKIHPRDKDNHLWKNVISIISSKIKNLEVINENINAEALILESKIVISDVSTVLWWASFFKDKIAISLDIFHFRGGHEMSAYSPQIHYIDTLKKLENINFPLVTSSKKKISVLDFI